MMNLKYSFAFCFAGFLGLFQTAHAEQPLAVDLKITNGLLQALQLTSASWPLGDTPPESFAISQHGQLNFMLTHSTSRKAQVIFRYSSGSKVCKFSAGHYIKESFGWFSPTKTPVQWAKATSEGNFVAGCTAKVVSNVPGQGYKVEFGMN